MSWLNNEQHYGRISIALHWLMLMLMIGVYGCIEFRELYERGSDPREALKAWHFTLGLSVFVIIWFRIGLYVLQHRPAVSPQLPVWQARLSRVVHIALLLLMAIMPIGGWLILSAEGDPIPFWGMELPALIGQDEELAHTIHEIHETVGKVGYFLIGLHAAAALFHHFIRKDNTLVRMLPRSDG